ncbi:uncharacterized protein N7446_001205 [Penicillium canescens]|uniref:Zn(2)-C6 fungal-type domain-containing protein n=1 Tax=Penicillium canescens TaxID=5083 RepID=A0AAD6IBN7_PENCN|nr:uncharacterized protein N7446_001205 [Penicillium canescens]KAJ6043009.1 hypothetical protein N7460_004364 [Penicillium canescens]KAJ6054483.1 hypothetical protein N7444_003581 [Penicillium canescens]KAJ6073428.1 hypothetical protein N7446_001205 [Penicillium canescens]
MNASPSPSFPSSPDTSAPVHKRPTGTRACDRCRRRKARCDFADSGQERCTNCHEADKQCRFDDPVARRGPKAQKKRTHVETTSSTRARSSLSFSLSNANPTAELNALSTSSATPSSQWERSRSLNADLGLSPQAISNSVPSGTATARQRWQSLSSAFSTDLELLVTRCFNLFFEYLYPLTPLVHEPSLRDSLSYFNDTFPAREKSSICGLLERGPDTAFTLITAVCAEAAFLLPEDLFPEGQSVGHSFLNASRNCLNQYLEADLENPNASSITIRYFHSNCLHAAGKPKYSWHIFGEATRLAQVMELNEEASLEGLPPIEAELRRRAFWIVYMGDKSAAILNDRPITIHQFSFKSGITTAYPTGIGDEAPVLSPENSAPTSEVTRKTCIEGFNANLRLWQNASDLLLELRLLQGRERAELSIQPLLTADERNRLDTLYIRFITCLDNLPPYLQSYTFAVLVGSSKETTQVNQFLIQCANLQVSVHCLRMVITQKLEGLPYCSLGVELADLRKTEIARDMLRVIQEAPFWSLQVNGEPYVEKIRLVGAILLEIIHRNGSSPIAARARSDFAVLLDLLARLDSKASDALRNDPTFLI